MSRPCWNSSNRPRPADVQFDAIVFATSSGGTQSGLVLGAKLSGYTGRVLGISVDHRADQLVPLLVDLANATAQHIARRDHIQRAGF